MKVAFAGSFAVRLAEQVRARLTDPCEIVTGDEAEILPALADADVVVADGPIIPMHFRKGSTELRLFTTIATLGTPQDITLQELRIESFFPMDEATRELFRMQARPAAHLTPSPARPA